MHESVFLLFILSFIGTYLMTPWIIPKLRRAKITGKDMNKPGMPEIPEMGGFAIVFGTSLGVLTAIAAYTFSEQIYSITGLTLFPELRLELIFASLSTILIISIIGIFDDLFSMRQIVKALLPLFAALPLVAVKAGTTKMVIPFIGSIEFGILYILILVPIGITGASNVTNMLAGFNGLEAGMGLVACLSLAFIAFKTNNPESFIILIAISGALLAFLFYNWYPAKILIGDIGTLTIGAAISSAVIVGNFETAGIIVIIPYAIDFFIKAINGFPSGDWWGTCINGKLYCKKKPISFCQWIMKLSNGISEQNLVLSLIFFEFICGIIAILIFSI
ncbi:MAG: hypothetical protein DRO94_02140 [Candidatus Altiarchaeales archaeon]|nr:MAG: hypothetical protein DRO95_00040 [Candidatus Altiarchaeales archaeon]RLI94754.1 MAG: hypothetical protein DRO94_02140 [Candidatus Altiarchaeales archaeon]HDO82809.1 hypothetical protein [Candidatus Altiarchaeales archaeon]HEX55458.1 hypothetical protein [Candidatus Altiarchaeales archaeon]